MNQVERTERQMKTVYAITEGKDGKSWWTKIGVGFVNRDGSITLKLDAFPIGSNSIQVRDYEPRDARDYRGERKPSTDALPPPPPAPRRDAIDALF